ncbi:MAG: hypothetical protein IKW08_01965 [Roseburia sp.]|nr:hypothetical protein [Roseburia sp.]
MGKIIGELKTNMDLWQLLLIEKCTGWIKVKEKRYEKFISEITQIDSIENYSEFYDKMQRALDEKQVLASTNYGAEATYYGYYDSLFEYAKMKKGRLVLIPSFEHGVRFGAPKWRYKNNSVCYACQGPKRVYEIHDVNPLKPVFVLGPYIHYAQYYYSVEKMQMLKQQFGKTLLVFPSHTCEDNQQSRNEKAFVDVVKDKYLSEYDTLLVCMYWNDINDPVVDAFKQIGGKIVSAGFRGDTNFIKRLKTLLYLADDVVVNDIGTNIGFAYYMGCNVYLEANKKQSADKVFQQNYNIFEKAFYSPNKRFSVEQRELQEKLYNDYWGGQDFLLSQEDIKGILETLQYVCAESKYSIKHIPIVMKQIICDGKNSNEQKKRRLSEIFKNSIAIKDN